MIVVFPPTEPGGKHVFSMDELGPYLTGLIEQMPGFCTRVDCWESLKLLRKLRDYTSDCVNILNFQLNDPGAPKEHLHD